MTTVLLLLLLISRRMIRCVRSSPLSATWSLTARAPPSTHCSSHHCHHVTTTTSSSSSSSPHSSPFLRFNNSFQVSLGSSSVSFLQLFLQRTSQRSVVPVTKPTASKRPKELSALITTRKKAIHWSPPFLIHCQTPQERSVAPLRVL